MVHYNVKVVFLNFIEIFFSLPPLFFGGREVEKRTTFLSYRTMFFYAQLHLAPARRRRKTHFEVKQNSNKVVLYKLKVVLQIFLKKIFSRPPPNF